MPKAIAIIPARLESTRLERKLLQLVKDKPLIQWTYEATIKSKLFNQVIVATDSDLIKSKVESFGGTSILTPTECPSGTNRCAFALRQISLTEDAVVVNIQGDEPVLDVDGIREMIDLVKNKAFPISTIGHYTNEIEIISNPNRVKIARSRKGRALYFSRSPIPYDREADGTIEALIHRGIYAFTVEALKRIETLSPSPLDLTERLEQLTWLEDDLKIGVVITSKEKHWSIDTLEDLEAFRAWTNHENINLD